MLIYLDKRKSFNIPHFFFLSITIKTIVSTFFFVIDISMGSPIPCTCTLVLYHHRGYVFQFKLLASTFYNDEPCFLLLCDPEYVRDALKRYAFSTLNHHTYIFFCQTLNIIFYLQLIQIK